MGNAHRKFRILRKAGMLRRVVMCPADVIMGCLIGRSSEGSAQA